MGEMTIRLDDALMLQLTDLAARRGLDVEALAAQALRRTLDEDGRRNWPVSQAILARGGPMSPISSVELLDQIRDEGQ